MTTPHNPAQATTLMLNRSKIVTTSTLLSRTESCQATDTIDGRLNLSRADVEHETRHTASFPTGDVDWLRSERRRVARRGGRRRGRAASWRSKRTSTGRPTRTESGSQSTMFAAMRRSSCSASSTIAITYGTRHGGIERLVVDRVGEHRPKTGHRSRDKRAATGGAVRGRRVNPQPRTECTGRSGVARRRRPSRNARLC